MPMVDAFWSIFLLGLLNSIVSIIGFTTITEKLLSAYAFLFQRKAHKQYVKAWRELREARQALAEISAQEEFARWARQQRQVDKLQAEHDQIIGERQRSLLAKTMGVALLLRIVLYAVIFWLVNIRYVRVGIACGINSIFGPLLKLLSLPYAPADCLSTTSWFAISTLATKRLLNAIRSH